VKLNGNGRRERRWSMSRNTGNRPVIEALQVALTDFLNDHRAFAQTDPEWVEGFKEWTEAERKQTPGCGCKLCESAGYLRGSI
jgi:hypothetical protein